MKKNIYLLVLPFVLLLSGCGGNELMGKWDVDTKEAMGMVTGTVEFTRSKMISIQKAMGTERQTELDVEEYKVEKNRVGVVIASEGKKETLWFDIVDPDTVKLNAGYVSVFYHRIK